MKIIIVILGASLLALGQAANLNFRLIGDIRPDTKPKSAAIFFNSDGRNICSGALIHSFWILTSATCARKLFDEERRVKIGGNVDFNFNTASHINNIIVHPGFHLPSLTNDIALVELAEPTNQINRILKITTEWIAKGQKAYSLGFGYADFGEENQYLGLLRQNSVNIIDNKICSLYSSNNNINRLCSYQSRACEGDQGGPLILETNKLIGLISMNQDQAAMCGDEVVSPITTYVRISGYVHWIRQMTKIIYI